MSEDKFINALYHWQSKRRYIELRNILQNNFISHPVVMRIQHMFHQMRLQILQRYHKFWCNLLYLLQIRK